MNVTIRDAQDRAAALRMLRAVEQWAVEPASAEEMAEGCAVLDVIEDGQPVGAVAVRIEGQHATITAATASGELTWHELAMIERLLCSQGVRSVGLFTRRPGLVRRLGGLGYELKRAELYKVLDHGQ